VAESWNPAGDKSRKAVGLRFLYCMDAGDCMCGVAWRAIYVPDSPCRWTLVSVGEPFGGIGKGNVCVHIGTKLSAG
jgi:hypothetical protein